MTPRYSWRSTHGHRTITTIVKKLIPQWENGLYPAQHDLVARILDGQDVLCCMATGGGKSALFSVPILILREMARNSHLYPDLPTWALPQGIVITPTKGLSANILLQVLELKKLGVSALAYCHDTVTEARMTGRNLVKEIMECKTWNVICVDPEHLRDKAWREITASDTYRANIVYGSVDEAHLINEWGADFRKLFKHIGRFFRGCLPSSISILALSATLQPGSATKSVLSSLGMLGDDFYVFRSSNERPNTQFIMEPLQHGVGGKIFPQLLDYLNSRRKAVVHCRTIDDVLRVFLYLWKSLPPGPHRLRRLRMYHSLRDAEENQEILRLLDEDAECQVVIATIAFANGLNVKSLLDSISLGFPDTVDQLWQEKGRVGRDTQTAARGLVLFQPSALAAAEKQIAGDSRSDTRPTTKSKTKRAAKPLEQEKAEILTEKICYIAAFNRIYKNSPIETSYLDCISAERRFPCSLCAARKNITLAFSAPPLPPGIELPLFAAPPAADPPSALDKKLRLTKKECELAEAALLEFGGTIHRAERKLPANRNRPKSSFFPTSIIRSILDVLLTLDSLENLEALLTSWVFAMGYRVRLYAVVRGIQATISSHRETARLERNAKQRATRQKKKAVYHSESEDEVEEEESVVESSSEEEVDHPRSSPIPPPPKRTRRVLEEVTNDKRQTRAHPPAKKAPRQPLQKASEVSQSYRPAYRTSRRRGALVE
ncbi:P-loop containing nucleoside triphosphate hydrolase protein [Mycena albidolilacea]|uniref:DNA 3'-5' helicase n=1 Tax=Mycena albidolilacea TaxID=1033008 RepID=A0AAD7ECL9_9AGAR|nr:P-loop containing nucleoside triphosphate hydrolase protein [Mycena albidolilacea]